MRVVIGNLSDQFWNLPGFLISQTGRAAWNGLPWRLPQEIHPRVLDLNIGVLMRTSQRDPQSAGLGSQPAHHATLAAVRAALQMDAPHVAELQVIFTQLGDVEATIERRF